MKKTIFLALAVSLLLMLSATAMAKKTSCTTIQSGTLLASDGSVITTGYDVWGYNYQAHLFNGYYCDAYRDAAWCQPYKDDKLSMKWNDAWLSNMDCDGDGLLDRHYGLPSYIGSGAWLTNHMSGEYIGDDGQVCKWNEFVKIVAMPTADYDCAAYGGVKIWGEFCETLDVYNDQCTGDHGVALKADVPGFGLFK